MSTLPLRHWVKAQGSPLARLAYRTVKGLRSFRSPVVPGVHDVAYAARTIVLAGWREALRILWHTPLFLTRVEHRPQRIMLYGGMPQLIGKLSISIGEDCRISGQTTFTGRTGARTPELHVGRNCDIGWQTTIAVGTRVILGDNVRIAGRAFLAGYPGHPIDAEARAAGLPDLDSQCGDIILESDVWLATNVTVSAGVRIGRGTIVAAGSVVTRDLPPFVLAGGVPARVIRPIASEGDSK